MMESIQYYFYKGLRRCLALAILALWIFASPDSAGAQTFPINVNTTVLPPIPPYLSQLSQEVSRHLAITLRYSSASRTAVRIKLAGKIERLSPSPISVSLRPDYVPAQPLDMGPQQPFLNLTQDMLEAAFGNFAVNDLEFVNTDLDQLRDGVNYKLPEGVYRICVTAYDYDKPGFSTPLSIPGTGCAVFTICYTASAPQLIQPVNTMIQMTGMGTSADNSLTRTSSGGQMEMALVPGHSMALQTVSGMPIGTEFQALTPHSSQISFTWTPPATTCGTPLGALQYDLEIRQVFQGQAITDALNNPFVFRQTNLPTTTFLLDTLKYPHILIPGYSYITRVRAHLSVPASSPLSISNQGYSQVGAFTYTGPTGLFSGPMNTEAYTPTSIPVGAACPDIPSVSNTTPIAAGASLNGQDLGIGAFTLHTDNNVKSNGDGTYSGTGYIIWSPYGHPIQLKVGFSKLQVNTDKVIFGGSVITSTDPTHPEWAPLGVANQAASLTGLSGNAAFNSLEGYVNNAAHLVNEIAGNDPVDFPIGLNNASLAGVPTTLAIMGITFTPAGTNMNVLFNLNIPEANDWLSLAGTGFCINPGGMSFSQGILYLPKDHPVTMGSGAQPLKFNFKQCTYDPSTNSVDTAMGTYVQWNSQGLQQMVATVGIGLPGSDIVPVDGSDNRLTGQQDSATARFTFTDWNDWMASLTFNTDFELAGLPGFPIHTTGGFYDHSTKVNPPGIVFPTGYKGAQDVSFEGLFINSLTMSLPKDFKDFGTPNGRASFGFNDFILDNTGVTTTIAATNLLTLGSGGIGGWSFSVDTISIAIVQNNPLQGMHMSGGIQLPLSADPLGYTCNLNPGEGSGIQYQFAVRPAGAYNVKMWAATLGLDGNSALTIDNKTGSFVINAALNGHVSISTGSISTLLPDVTITALTFQGLALTNNYQGTGQFHFDAGNWSLGGSPLKSLAQNNRPGGVGDDALAMEDRVAPNGPSADNALPDRDPSTPFDGGDGSGSSADGFGINLNGFKPYFQLNTSGAGLVANMGITFTMNVNLDISGIGIGGGATMDVFGTTTFPASGSPQINITPNVNLDSVYINGNFGPLSIDGGLQFFRGTGIYGDGVMGFINADFLGIGVNAAARFGSVNGNNYWGVAARFYTAAGIVFPPGLSINGLGGGFHYNMKVQSAITDSASLSSAPASTPQEVINQLVPESGSLGFSAQVIMAFLQPNVVCLQPTFGMDFSSSAGLQDVWFDGAAEVLSTNPPEPNTGMVNAHAHAIYTTNPGNFNCILDVNAQIFNVASINIPIQFNTGAGGDYLYIGYPASNDQDMNHGGDMSSMVNVQMGFDVGVAHASVTAYAYFDIGDKLPSAPYIPPSISNVKDHDGNSMAQGALNAFTNTLTALESPMGMGSNNVKNGTVSNPGFMFGAGVHVDAGIDLVVVSADGSIDIGFAALMEHFNPSDVLASGCATNGTIGFNNWYAMGIFYADFSMDLQVIGVTVGSLNAGAVLSAGLVSPTWAAGDVFIDASALGIIHFHDYTSVSIGSPCKITRDPLGGIDMISDFGPREQNNTPVDVYEIPYVIGNVPLNSPYKVQVNTGDVRVYQFIIDQFDVTNGKGQPLVISLDYKGTFEADLDHKEMLCGNSNYSVHVRCRAQQLGADGQWHDPTGSDGNPETVTQDTTFTFTTGPRPQVIDAQNVIYSYPIDGQRYLLKGEFGSVGSIAVGQDINYLLHPGQVDDCGDPLNNTSGYDPNGTGTAVVADAASGGNSGNTGNSPANRLVMTRVNAASANLLLPTSTQYLAKFIPAGGGDTLQTSFSYSTGDQVLRFAFPAGLQNSKTYTLQVWVVPPVTPKSNNASTVSNQQTQTVTESESVLTRSATGSLVQTNISKTINVGVTTQSLSGGRQLANKDSARCIYSSLFATSKYNLFSNKMADYGVWKSLNEDAGQNITIYDDATAAEPFDQFEIKGYQSKCNTITDPLPLFAPLFNADVPWNPASHNDQEAGGNIYAGIVMLSNYSSIDLGVPQVRGSFDIPVNAMSLQNMPYQPPLQSTDYLPGLSSVRATVNYSSAVNNITAAGANTSMYFQRGMSYELPRSMMGVRLANGGAITGGNSPASAPATIPPGLLWQRDAYFMADYELAQQLAYDVPDDQAYLNGQALSDLAAYCFGCTVTQVQGEYGTITMSAGNFLNATSAANQASFWGQLTALQNLRFPYFPAQAGRPMSFGYAFSICPACGVAPAQATGAFNYKTVSIYNTIRAAQINTSLPTQRYGVQKH